MFIRATILAFTALCAAGTLLAQCPDGTPPPCRSASAAPRAAAPSPTSLAVLPFESRTADTTQAYLAEGMTDEIGNRLTQVGRLAIKPRGIVAAQWRRTPDPLQAAQRLNVAWFVHGSVRHAGAQLLVNVQLGRVTTGQEVWASRFVRGDADMFAVQAEVAESVAAVVGGRLSPGERATIVRRPTRDNEAYRLYVYGNAMLKRRTQAEAQLALEAFTEAARRDSTYAAAWARISMVRTIQFSWQWDVGVPRDSLLALARPATRRALALDSLSADAWAADASLGQNEGDVERAHTSCTRALALDSLRADVWHLCGSGYGAFGPSGLMQPAVAEPFLRRALALDPDFRNSWRHLAHIRRGEGRLAEAEALYDTTLSAGPWVPAFIERGGIRLMRANASGALADFREARRLSGLPPDTTRSPLEALVRADSAPMRIALARAVERAQRTPDQYAGAATGAALLGQRDDALTYLERYRAGHVNPRETRCSATTTCSPSLDTWRLLHEPAFIPLRNEARFVSLWNETRPRIPWLASRP